jgi:hypothetical protein
LPGISTDLERAEKICKFFWGIVQTETTSTIFRNIQQSISAQKLLPATALVEYNPVTVRKKALSRLQAHSEPLSRASYETLLQVVIELAKDIPHGLPSNPDLPACSCDSLVDKLYTRRVEKENLRPCAPFFKKSFAYVLLGRICAKLPFIAGAENTPVVARALCIRLLVSALKSANLVYLPWYCQGPRNATRSDRAADFHTWIVLNQPGPVHQSVSLSASMKLTPEGRVLAQASIAAISAWGEDPTATWNFNYSSLEDLSLFLSKAIPPLDFNWKYARFKGTMEDVAFNPSNFQSLETEVIYKWVFLNIDIRKPIHRLAVWLAAIVGRMLPNVFFSANNSTKLSLPSNTPNNPTAITAALQSFHLTSRNQKGHKDPKPYITIATVVFIALWDAESPLRKYLADDRLSYEKTKFGEKWTNKHSECL